MMSLRSLGGVMLFSVAATFVAGVPTRAEDSAAIVTLPTRLDPATEQLLIGVDAAGARLWCSVDTGFSALVAIDRTKAHRAGIGELPGKPTPDGRPPFRGDGSATVTLQVGPITLRDQPVIVRDVASDPQGMDCVMGAALLRTYVTELDYEAARVRLHAASGFTSPPGASSVPLIFRTNPSVPFVPVHVDLSDGSGRDLQTLVDTGASYYALAVVPPASTWMRERTLTSTRPEHPATASGAVDLVAARPRRLTVGPFHVAQPVIALVSSAFGGVDDGLLGVGFLRRFTVWIDFNGRAMYLRPNRNLEAPQLFDASGVGFKHVAGGYEVEVVLPGTPAASADIRVGDRLVTIDGQRATELGPAVLRERLSRGGSRCELVLQRGENPHAVTLMLATRL